MDSMYLECFFLFASCVKHYFKEINTEFLMIDAVCSWLLSLFFFVVSSKYVWDRVLFMAACALDEQQAFHGCALKKLQKTKPPEEPQLFQSFFFFFFFFFFFSELFKPESFRETGFDPPSPFFQLKKQGLCQSHHRVRTSCLGVTDHRYSDYQSLSCLTTFSLSNI